jgi:UDP-galactopyranose mutase
MKYDFLIVGAGLAGSVLAERIASQLNKKVLLIDKRNHIGGNCYDAPDENGILVHKYGPHIFHTHTRKPFDYLSQFTDWSPYEHEVLGSVEDKLVPVPFNFNSLHACFPKEFAITMEEKLTKKFGNGIKIPILKLKQDEDPDIRSLAEYIYENVFLNYTIKQWGLTPEELDPSVTSRIPVFLSRDNRYFQDDYQQMPKEGYTIIFKKMLANPNITLKLNTNFKEIKDIIEFDYLIYTGAIDEFFDYEYGPLPYRSLSFEFKQLPVCEFQPVAQVNYPNTNEYTRITEFKHFLPTQKDSTTIAYEYPEEFIENKNERFYPIPQEKNRNLYEKYLVKAESLGNTFFVGRLAEYKYYNMNEIISVSLAIFETKIRNLF